MKNNLPVIAILAFLISACATTKITKTDDLSGITWELDYISGSRIAFEGLYPDKKPRITFDSATNQVSGTASCNGYSAKYTLNGNLISFGEPGITTMMFCEGGGENAFLQTIKKVNNYAIDKENKLNLMVDGVAMMRFKKIK
ncbi:META domain-containing protein [Flavobacterium sp.]|uniref:META domain-containing protein n=1 Tax=Flavobacterium sp. TaxID=239 RepID=UPI00286A1E18|nr:META domain-containing protein [Flavobacterium sp.]